MKHVAMGAPTATPPVAEIAQNRVTQVGQAGPDLVQEPRAGFNLHQTGPG